MLNLDSNSAPFINYAYTRICGILNKIPKSDVEPNFNLLSHPIEKQLIFMIMKFPEIFKNGADQLKPEDLANFVNNLAEKFHEYYEKISIIRTKEAPLQTARKFLIEAIKITTETWEGHRPSPTFRFPLPLWAEASSAPSTAPTALFLLH